MKRAMGTVTCLLVLIITSSSWASFVDNFDRPDSQTVGNGWTENDTSTFNVQISGNQLSWLPRGNGNGRVSSSLTHTFDPATTVSVDMRTATIHSTSDTEMRFTIEDASGNSAAILLTETIVNNAQTIRIYQNSIEQVSRSVTDNTIYHNYAFDISGTGKITVTFDDVLQWQSGDGAMGSAVSSTIWASRWWEWCKFEADNFSATPEPTTLGVLGFGALGLLRRHRRQ